MSNPPAPPLSLLLPLMHAPRSALVSPPNPPRHAQWQRTPHHDAAFIRLPLAPMQCRDCPTGYVAQPGSTRCSACLPGTYYGQQNFSTPYQCLPCPEGELDLGFGMCVASEEPKGDRRVFARLWNCLAACGMIWR